MSFSHVSILNVTIARDCMVKRTTVNLWISILHDLLITSKFLFLVGEQKEN